MKKFILLLAITFLFSSYNSFSQNLYGGIGGNYYLPLDDFSQVNENSIGFNLHLERRFCNIWYGLNIDYANFQPKGDIDISDEYVENMLTISPTVKYNYLCLFRECNSFNWFPYVQMGLNISSITSTDDLGKLGVGVSPGFGLAYSFLLFKQCMMLDGNVQYMLPNAIYRDEDRANITTLKVGLNLSVKI